MLFESFTEKENIDSAAVQSPELEVPEDFNYDNEISGVLLDIKNMNLPKEEEEGEKVQEGEKEGVEEVVKEVENEGAKDVKLAEQVGMKQGENEGEKEVKSVEQVGEIKKEEKKKTR